MWNFCIKDFWDVDFSYYGLKRFRIFSLRNSGLLNFQSTDFWDVEFSDQVVLAG